MSKPNQYFFTVFADSVFEYLASTPEAGIVADLSFLPNERVGRHVVIFREIRGCWAINELYFQGKVIM